MTIVRFYGNVKCFISRKEAITMAMDEKLQRLMQELGQAINDALSGSERIAEAIEAIQKAGYEVFLILECTIGFQKQDDASTGKPESPRPSATTGGGKPNFTSEDQRFMKSMKISLGEDPNNPPKKQ